MDFFLAAQRERIRCASALWRSEHFEIAPLLRFRHAGVGDGDAWAFLTQMSGVRYSELPAQTLSDLQAGIEYAMDLPAGTLSAAATLDQEADSSHADPASAPIAATLATLQVQGHANPILDQAPPAEGERATPPAIEDLRADHLLESDEPQAAGAFPSRAPGPQPPRRHGHR